MHDQDWRDFQPLEDPDSSKVKFQKALDKAVHKVNRSKQTKDKTPQRKPKSK